MKRLIVLLLALLFFVSSGLAGPAEDLQVCLSRLDTLEHDLREQTLSLLIMLKPLQQSALGQSSGRLKIISPTVPVYESDQPSSRQLTVVGLNEEFTLLEKRDSWFLILLPDGRQGWIREDHGQVTSFMAPELLGQPQQLSESEIAEILNTAESWLQEINAGFEEGQQVMNFATATFQSVENPVPSLVSLYTKIQQKKKSIFRYHTYANFYYHKYAALYQTNRPVDYHFMKNVDGRLAVQLGSSSYEDYEERSLTSRDLDFSIRKILDERSNVTAAFTHKNDVIQTPYGSSDLNLGYNVRTESGVNLRTFANWHGYNDKSFDRNSFNRMGLGYHLLYDLSPTTLLFNDFRFQNKNFKETDDFNYNSSNFKAGLKHRICPQRQVMFTLNGTIQASDAAYLHFNRFVPQLRYEKRADGRSFEAGLETGHLGYKDEANGQNYHRERLDLAWAGNNSSRQIFLIGKQFPNNQAQGYIKLGGQMNWFRYVDRKSTRNHVSLLYVHYPQAEDRQVNYFDIRVDRSHDMKSNYYNFNVFSRIWTKSEATFLRDHILDFYGVWGWRFGKIRVGPLLGAHLLLNKESKVFLRDGNSLRAGLDFTGLFVFKTSRLNITLRYERNFLFSSELDIDASTGEATYGELVTRKPSTLQLVTDFRVPVSTDLELHFILKKYEIDLDLDEETSVDPLMSRSRLVLMAGLGYRFGQ
ncbi:hypothetical protein GF407_20500 [candidate division KSB1 bacterium]|nr:hypothetical protein [candidate division KSB1 bacterium]